MLSSAWLLEITELCVHTSCVGCHVCHLLEGIKESHNCQHSGSGKKDQKGVFGFALHPMLVHLMMKLTGVGHAAWSPWHWNPPKRDRNTAGGAKGDIRADECACVYVCVEETIHPAAVTVPWQEWHCYHGNTAGTPLSVSLVWVVVPRRVPEINKTQSHGALTQWISILQWRNRPSCVMTPKAT